jgi:hypothetical protein
LVTRPHRNQQAQLGADDLLVDGFVFHHQNQSGRPIRRILQQEFGAQAAVQLGQI